MRTKIYQINSKLDTNRVKFLGTDELESLFGKVDVNPTIYELVFDADIDEIDLEDIFKRFNTDGHPLYRGSSMSVSDIVVNDEGAFYCDSIGFKRIDFDESQAVIPDNLLKIVYVEPNRPAYASYIENNYDSESKAVKGMIELIYNDDGTILVGNDEAKIIGMEGNRHLDNGVSIIAGPFFVIGDDGEDFRSLTDEEVNKYVQKYAEPEDISDEETQADMGVVIMSW